MILKETKLNVIDSSGALVAQCIGLYQNQKVARAGDVILVSIKKAKAEKRVKKGEIHKAVVVQTKSVVSRVGGNLVNFNDNAIVLLKKEGLLPFANRLRGYVFFELRKKGFIRVVIMSLGVI